MKMTMRLLAIVLVALLGAASAFSTPPRTFGAAIQSSLRLADEPASSAEDNTPPPQPVKCPDCDLCDGSGRILGGLGAVIPWIPIKAYRPCPNFIDNGGFYQRAGQPLDEIAFGRDSTYNGP